jgi:hypothetical protein
MWVLFEKMFWKCSSRGKELLSHRLFQMSWYEITNLLVFSQIFEWTFKQ